MGHVPTPNLRASFRTRSPTGAWAARRLRDLLHPDGRPDDRPNPGPLCCVASQRRPAFAFPLWWQAERARVWAMCERRVRADAAVFPQRARIALRPDKTNRIAR